MSTPGRLSVGRDGRLSGPAHITYNNPFPCVNGKMGVTGKTRGVVMHTIVGNLSSAIAVFNNPAMQASAHFGIAQDGQIHQFGPVGKGWEAWAQVAGNLEWYSIEHADNGDQHNPLTAAQIVASAQVVECLSHFAGFPLQVTNSTSGTGYGVHNMGGQAWGGHTCPGPGPRADQRNQIIALAKSIRVGNMKSPGAKESRVEIQSPQRLAVWCKARNLAPSTVLRMTAANSPGGKFPDDIAAYINAAIEAFDGQLPAGTHLWSPKQ